MTRIFKIHGRDVSFTEVTACCSMENSERYQGIMIHDSADTFGDGDGIIFDALMPENEEEAVMMIENYFIDTDYRTLETVEFI